MNMNAANGTGDAPGKVKILIVDDLDDNLLSLEAILDSLGQTLIRARSGEEAMRLALQHDFGVILLDVVMPGLDGFETASMLKRHDKTQHVPIIFLTAAEDSRDATFRGYAVGAADYITKPFDPWVLRAKVLVFVDLYRKTRMLAAVSGRLAEFEDRMRRLDDGSPPGAPSEQLGQLAERIAALRTAVESLFPADDMAEVGQSGGLASRVRVPPARLTPSP